MSHSDISIQLEFDVNLSFAQELRETFVDSGIFLPASNTILDPELKGHANLRFSPDFKTLDIKLDVSGDLSGDHAVTLVHLHLDDSSKTGPLTVSLYPNDKAKTETKKHKHFVLKIRLTNDDVIPRNNDNFSTNTIASLYNVARNNNLYIDAHGSGDYLLGMIRGQLYLSN